MKLDRRTSWAVVVALASALAACAEQDHPPITESAPVSSVSLGGSAAEADTGAGVATPTAEPGPCVPKSTRECKIYYRDDTGQLQCPENAQFCDEDGSQWLPCGAYTLDENGDLQPIH